METRTYQTRELSVETWSDFERLFGRGNGWDHCWCTAFQQAPRPSRKQFRTRAEVAVVNHEIKRQLVEEGRAHGILVYANGEPIGWCQYGSSEELTARPGTAPAEGTAPLWRVTCFVVDKRHRRQGVAGLALRAALESIRARGGGLIEAYPIAHWSHGRGASPGGGFVQGVGPVAPAWGTFGNVSTSGVVSMFEQERFAAVAVCGGDRGCHVLMRRTVLEEEGNTSD